MTEPLRLRVAIALDPVLRLTPGLSLANRVVIGLILCSVLVAVLATESVVTASWGTWIMWAESIFLVFFTLEYVLRVWVSVENCQNRSRWHYVRRPAAMFDLITLILIAFTFFGSSGFLLRVFRLLRLVRVARLGRFSSALELLGAAVSQRRFELWVTAAAALFLLFFSSALLYLVEGGAQPDEFGSIPRAMWWSVATLTTVGYGDAYPVTALGRLFAAFTAVAGIGLIAMPTGILAGAFSDAIQQARLNGEILEKSDGD